MQEEGQNLPKATMLSFIKNKLPNHKLSDDFVKMMLYLSKEYIARISNQANIICQQQGKKVINAQHLYASIQKNNGGEHLQLIKQLQQQIKQKQKYNKDRKQIVSANTRQLIRRYSQQQGISLSVYNNNKVEIKQQFVVLSDSQEDNSVEEDYQAAMIAQNQKKQQKVQQN